MSEQLGVIRFEVTGDDLTQLTNESGNHRLQRVPPTERKGRVHTSSITVAVIDEQQFAQPSYTTIQDCDLKIEWYSGTGAGGQHRNKHQNSIRLTHIDTGITMTAQCRSRENSYNEAYANLVQALRAGSSSAKYQAMSIERKRQMGSGQRSDNKIRTYRFQDDIASDDRTLKKASLAKVMRGHFDLLW